jgi:Membrane bound beta barrel domain (DUF5777)
MKRVFIVLILSAFFARAFGQENTQAQEVSKPVGNTFGTGILIDNPTIGTPYKGGLEMEIRHRFSIIDNIHDIYGIYGAANTRIGLSYGITEKLMVGVGTTKDYQMQDIQWKYLILQQTEDNKMPFSLSYFGNIAADLRTKDNFGPGEFRSIHRLSYFTEFIFARKINNMFSVQIAPSMAYFNSVPTNADSTIAYKNLNIGLSAGARANLFGSHSLILEYDQLFTKQNIAKQPKPNLAVGWEIGTGTHTFQVFVTNYNQIISQRNLVFNTNDFSKGKYLVGFNITIRF